MRALPEDEVHVWLVRLDAPGLDAAHLSLEERDRAAAFRVEDARRRHVASRASLRLLLSEYLGAPPASHVFLTDCARCGDARHGKPRLAEGGLRFSTSHAGDLVAHAFARRRELGIDVEALDARIDPLEVARQFFSAEERSRLAALPDAARLRAFLESWTRKEARLKLAGVGLAELERAEDEAPGARVEALALPPTHVGALAVDVGAPLLVRTISWPT